jgi:Flp pilus assembly protein protease CpaA
MTWLLIFILVLSLYDWRTRRIPNWCTLPVILAGMIAHFPGFLDLWLACFLLVSAWSGGWMGAGDVKLWMAVLWALPNSNSPSLILLIFLSFLLTGLAQILLRILQNQPTGGVKFPAAWRVIPFLLMVWHVH